MSEQVYIFDTTLRDGEQSPGCSMDFKEKIAMARQLERLRVDILEAGFPIASQGDFDAVRGIAAEIRTPVIAALARASELDIERAWEAIRDAARPRIHTFLATSDIHLKYKLHKTREEILKMISRAVGHCEVIVRGRGILSRGCGPHGPQLPDRVLPCGGRGRRHGPESSRHGGILPGAGIPADVRRRSCPSA